MKKPDIPQDLIKFIISSLLSEVGKDGVADTQERLWLVSLLKSLNISPLEFKELKKGITFEKAVGAADLNAFFQALLQELIGKRHLLLTEAWAIMVFIHQSMDCEKDFSSEQLKTLFDLFQEQHDNFEERISSDTALLEDETFGGIADPECTELLREIYEKDWETELNDFKNIVVQLRADEAVDEHIKKRQEEGIRIGAITGLIVGALFGMIVGGSAVFPLLLVTAISLASVAFMMAGPYGMIISPILLFVIPIIGFGLAQISGILAWLLAVLSAAIIGVSVGAGLGVKYRRKTLYQQRPSLEQGFLSGLNDYILSPRDMLRFWNNKVEVYLHEKKAIVSNKIKMASGAKAQLMKTAAELSKYTDAKSKVSVQRLQERAEVFTHIINDASKVNVVLQKVEDKFVGRIEELQAVIKRQEEIERSKIRKEELEARARYLLDGTETAMEDWQEEKEDLHNELSGMMSAFQKELLTAKDTIRAEIELNVLGQ